MTNLSVPEIIAAISASVWLGSHLSIHRLATPEALRQHLSMDAQENSKDIASPAAYATGQQDGKNTNYDIMNVWPVNYVRGQCSLDGQELALSGICYNDETMSRIFHFSRPASKVLDIVEWIKSKAMQCGFVADHLETMPDSKIPFSAFHWMVVLRRGEASPCGSCVVQ